MQLCLLLGKTVLGGRFYYSHFVDEEAEAQGSHISWSQNKSAVELRRDSIQLNLTPKPFNLCISEKNQIPGISDHQGDMNVNPNLQPSC